MPLMIYNSLSNKIEEFIPEDKNNVKMYVCGPTVYSDIHIGNGRPVVFYDMLRNYLEFIGYHVTYASNITDVDDKIINNAIKNNMSESEYAKKYEKLYFEAYEKLGSRKPDLIPHATEYIPDMIEFINELLEKGYAYQKGGNVYFRINKIPDYGCLSNQVSEDLEEGARVDIEAAKENPLDFNLWKDTKVGIKYPSPFGAGRPGWHTECVVMNHRLFGNSIDIHGGGMDLKFPHHENEIAQSEALYHNHLSKYWIHVGRLNKKNEKMSKSLGNTILVKDLTDEEARIMRMLLLFSPYRNIIEYSDELFKQYEKEYQKWQRAIKQANLIIASKNINEEASSEDIEKFISYMNQDLNVQNVMTLLQEILKTINTSIRGNDYVLLAKKTKAFMTILNVFAINLNLPVIDEEVINYYNRWQEARVNKDYETADECRNYLAARSVI